MLEGQKEKCDKFWIGTPVNDGNNSNYLNVEKFLVTFSDCPAISSMDPIIELSIKDAEH